MDKNKLLCMGYGYTARFFSQKLKSQGWKIAGTTRSREKAKQLREQDVEAIIWNGGAFDLQRLEDVSAVLISTPPDENGCPAFDALAASLATNANTLNWIGYLSTNGVYGDHDGAWVDEKSALKATTARARRRIKSENDWRLLAEKHSLPLTIFRLPGIYGPGRSAINSVRAGKAKRIYKKGQVFSRMHVEDIAAALDASLTGPRAHDLYNLSDNEPAPPQDIVEYACKLLGVAPPPLVLLEEAHISEMAKSFYADNKRVSNRRIKDALAFTLTYPTYKEGLKAILNQENQ
ncbi:SDR family oxidoreductase [Hyphococcus sp.]|uniref:SDR family oxidoreductase n=1 Tax=Hyphococcus sp. TaxID=2038636 RepID=UPI003CCBA6E0